MSVRSLKGGEKAATDEDLPPTDAEICQAKVVFERGAMQQLCGALSLPQCVTSLYFFRTLPAPSMPPRYLGGGRQGGIKVKGDDASRLGIGKRLRSLLARACALNQSSAKCFQITN